MTQDDEVWFEDYVRSYIGSDLPHLPPHTTKVGATTATWVEPQPGFYTLQLVGGSHDDQWFAEQYVSGMLEEHGLERQMFTFTHEHKTADYSDVESKAVRLIQSGKVHVQANHADEIQGIVEGDHGTYEVNIKKDANPESESISRWNCECDWGQFAWGRTRQWKRFEGRPCAHVLALYWAARSVPQEMEQIPEGWTEQPATAEGTPEGPAAQRIQQGEYPGAGGMVPPGASPMLMQPPQVPQAVGQGMPPGQAPEPSPALPPYPANPENMPAMNPVSVPGQKPQSPLNPIQNAGGTFSHVAAEKSPFNEGDMVQLKQDDIGQWVGLNGGDPKAVPANSIGQVEGTHPSTGLVEVYYPGPAANNGPNEPHGVKAWHWPADLIARPDIPPYGSATTTRRT
jgi:hypothetical protein